MTLESYTTSGYPMTTFGIIGESHLQKLSYMFAACVGIKVQFLTPRKTAKFARPLADRRVEIIDLDSFVCFPLLFISSPGAVPDPLDRPQK